jgi:hypothetical protein
MERTELIAVLLSWAASLSGYTYPETAPPVEYRGPDFFVEQACRGAEDCRVAAWYDAGTIYLREDLSDLEDPVVRSVVVHELVHYLQDLSGRFPVDDCESDLKREQEAYSIQRTYLNRIAGRFAATWPVWGPCEGTG